MNERRVLDVLDRADRWVGRIGVALLLLAAITFGGSVGLHILG